MRTMGETRERMRERCGARGGEPLHALLDGALRAMEPQRAAAVEAHLESCAECRALPGEAADLRGRAGEVLGLLEGPLPRAALELLGGAAAPMRGRAERR